MEVGTIIGDKAYSVQYIADAPRYADYLPIVQKLNRNSHWTYTGQQLIQDYLNYVQKSVGNAFNTRYYPLTFTASNGYMKISSWSRSMDYLAEVEGSNTKSKKEEENWYLVEEGYNDTEDTHYMLH